MRLTCVGRNSAGAQGAYEMALQYAGERKQFGRFLNEFQDRLLFGTDICAATQPLPLAAFLKDLRKSGKISEVVFRKIARENAVRLLGL